MIALATDARRHERLLELTYAAAHEAAACQAGVAEQDSPDLVVAFTLAALRDWLIPRFSNGLPTSVPATIAATGDPARAERLASAIPDPERQVPAFASLAIALLDTGHLEQARHTLGRLAKVVSTLEISSAHHPPHPALAAVAELAAAGQWTSAERVARAITDQSIQAQALRRLVSRQIADGHFDQAEYLALSLNSGEADHQALKTVIAALAAAGYHERAMSLARAFPDNRSSREYGGVLALPELTASLAVSGGDEKLHALIRHTPHEQIRYALIIGAVAAVAHAGDFDRAESLARSISQRYLARAALAEVVNELLTAGERDRAIALAQSVATEHPPAGPPRPQQERDLSPDQYLEAILRDRRRPSQTGDSASDEEVPGLAKRVALALSYLDAGDFDKAERTAYASNGSALSVRILCTIAAWMVVHTMIERAEQLADRVYNRRDQAEVLAAAAAAAAAIGDTASGRRLAGRAAMLVRARPGHRPHQLLLLAEALAQAGENAYARRVAERAVVLDERDDELAGRAAVVLAHAGAVSRAEQLARTLSSRSHSEPALEAVATALAGAGEFDHARSIALDMAEGDHKVRALTVIVSAMARADSRNEAWGLARQALEVTHTSGFSGDKARALHAIARTLI
ncbi:MAG: hypothetical protein ACRET2_10690, partial [Steroidobacteraceae bacterium]